MILLGAHPANEYYTNRYEARVIQLGFRSQIRFALLPDSLQTWTRSVMCIVVIEETIPLVTGKKIKLKILSNGNGLQNIRKDLYNGVRHSNCVSLESRRSQMQNHQELTFLMTTKI